MKNHKLINIYIIKNFLIRFLQIVIGFSLLFFFINLIDDIEKVQGSDATFLTIAAMAFLQVPEFLNDVIPSLVLISALITFFLLSSKSEITIMRMSGFSLWQVWRPVAVSAMLLGVFWVTIFGPISILMIKKFNNLEGKYVRNDLREVIAPENGIWLKQINQENPEEEIIIQAEKVYKENMEFEGVTIWFFDKNNQFYKKIDTKEMFLENNYWLLYDITVNDAKSLNKRLDTIAIKTDLQPDFIIEKIVNNFENVKLFSVFALPKLIDNMQSAGFASVKFKVYFHSLLIKPFLFLAMTLIACYFGLNHIRNQNSLLMIFLGITSGLALYIISSIINALGSSGLISIFASSWGITVICLAIGTLLIYQKENL
jgi:lipopolysaccharide export system permease protein